MLVVPHSSYYEYCKETPPSNRQNETRKLREDIMAVYIDSQKRYGAPKIRELLAKTYPLLSVNRVQRAI